MINITPTQLRKAADLQERIQSLQSELNEILGSEVSTPAQTTEAPKKKWKLSASSRAKMRAAQKARWAKIKGTVPTAKPAKKGRRKMSAQGFANIRAGVTKRMAAQGKAPAAKLASKRGMSPAAKKRMAALIKARWATRKAAGKTKL
jgi:hypothetical protein